MAAIVLEREISKCAIRVKEGSKCAMKGNKSSKGACYLMEGRQ